MEVKAYLEGIGRKWWVIGLAALAFWWAGLQIADNLTPAYMASTTILLNDSLLASAAFPTETVQLALPKDYEGATLSPALSFRIMKTYPRLTKSQIAKEVVVSTDQTKQLLFITVTDISPFAASDIANFLAQNFVQTQTASLARQLDYYQHWLQQNVSQLNDDINRLNQQIAAATPARPLHGPAPVLTTQQQIILKQYQYQVNQDRHTIYTYQQSLTEVGHALPLLPHIYRIVKAADTPDTPVASALVLPTPLVVLLTMAAGLLLTICLLVALEFFTPVIRHRGEMRRLLGITEVAELPPLRPQERRGLLAAQAPPSTDGVRSLRLLTAALGARIAEAGGHTVLLTSAGKKCDLAAVIAMFHAFNGYKTLLLAVDGTRPAAYAGIQVGGTPDIASAEACEPATISKTTHPDLFLLSLPEQEGLAGECLLELLPALQREFDLLVIDAPPLQHALTHMLAARAAQVVVFVRKRRDRLKRLKEVRLACQTMKVEPHYVFVN